MGFNIIWLTPDRFDLKPNKSPWLEMSKAFSKNGHKVTILTSKSKNKISSNDYGENIVYVKALDLPLIFRFSVLIRMLGWLKANASSNDLIIMNQDSLLIFPLLKLLGFNKIHLDIRTIPADRYNTKDHLDRFLYWYVPLKLFGTKVKSYTFITQRLKQEVEKEFNFKIDDYEIWQSGVSTEVFYPIDLARTPSSKFRLFYHGTVSINRGIGLVIQAMSLLDDNTDIEFIIAGDGTGTEELKKMTSDLSLSGKVTFLGLMPYESMVQEINKSDICICPLTDRLEWNVSSPIKVFEYMACGKPMILTPISAHKDVAEQLPFVVWTDGFEPEDYKNALLAAIERLEELSKLAKEGPDYVKSHFQWRNQAEKLERHLIKTMGAQ